MDGETTTATPKRRISQRSYLGSSLLQWVFGDRANGIGNGQDTANIQKGAEALRRYADLLLADGADAVVIAMHIYKTGMEPAIGNERLALARFLESKPANVYAGPDVWQPTSKLWPKAFKADKLHPNEMGAEVMAHHWFVTLLELCGQEVPAWSEAEMNKPLAIHLRSLSRAADHKEGTAGTSWTACVGTTKTTTARLRKPSFRGRLWRFTRFDRNKDGVVDNTELERPQNRPVNRQ